MKRALLAATAAALLPLLAGDALAETGKSPWLIRGRLIDVAPDEDSTLSIGGKVDADHRLAPELDISYFFTPHIAAELILATTKHDVRAKGTALGHVDLGHVWALPPTVTLQYHFLPEERFRPYVGAGINYMLFYGEDSGQVNDIDYENGLGYALQAGFDLGLDEHWALNVDVKKIFHNVDVKVNGGAVTADVDLDPWVFGMGVGYRF